MYGVDQCRVCGKPISPTNKRSRELQEEANRRPVIPEKAWRARGFLTSPTRQQLQMAPADGCCWECGLRLMNLKYKYSLRRYVIMAFTFSVMVFVVWVVTYLPH